MEDGILFEKSPEASVEVAPAKTEVVQMDYQSDFPSLPVSAGPAASSKPAVSWNRPRPTAASSTVVQKLILSPEERANKGKKFGNSSNEEHKKCQHIAQQTQTKIELSESKDGNLTIMIKGTKPKVEQARALLVKDLQTQLSAEIEIPKDHHRKLIGKEAAILQQMEADSNCKISLPKKDDNSNTIKITGPRDGIQKAIAAIKAISDREAKLAHEHIICPRLLVPFVRGPFNEIYEKLTAETGAKINIPPFNADNEVIIINGEREGVLKAAQAVREIVTRMQSLAKSVTCQIARSQHKYIRGAQHRGIHQILKDTGVWVEIPSEDENSETITLRGDPSKLGEALAQVYSRASSVITQNIECPTWLHKYIIGPKGATLGNLVPNRAKLQIDFDDSGVIFIEGPPEEVKGAFVTLSTEANKLKSEMVVEKIKVNPVLHRHVIGKGGSLISKLKNESGVQINIPNEETHSDEITVEGKKDGVKKAVSEIKALVSKIENEKSKDMIIEQRFHKMIIGSKGSEIQKIHDKYPNVSLNFPEQNKKSDIVHIRGDKNEVEAVSKILQTIVKELLENNYQQTVPIFKEFHKNIIGKGGATIRKIREETSTRIDLPDGDSGEERITVTGKKADVEKAIAELNKIQNEQANIVNTEIDIPVKVQARLLGLRRLISDIQEECGGVVIKFPSEKSESTKVTLRGPKDDVAKAERLLVALAKDKEQNLHEDTVKAKAEYHRFLIGKGGAKIKKIRDNNDVRVLFPKEGDADMESIHLLGKKDDVLKVKAELEHNIKELSETVEIKAEVDSKYHKHFLVRGAAVLKEIQEQNGGVSISFPKNDSTSVTIKGSKQCAESAKARIEEIVDDMVNQVSIHLDIPNQYHRALLTNRGQKIHDLQSKHGVQIRFPDRRREGEEEVANPDQVTISGRDFKCEAAREELLSLVPVQRTINAPVDAHRALIGKGGENVRKLMQDHDVNVSIPKNDSGSEEITVTGQLENVESALEALRESLAKYESEAEERRLKSFELVIEIPSEYHQRIVGARGSTITDIKKRHDVFITVPREDEKSDKITIKGKEENARACAAEIEGIVSDVRSMFSMDVTIDSRCHSILIGARGKNLKKLMEDYKVEIRFPREGAADPNLITVAGHNNDDVYDCIDVLRDEEEKWLEDNADRVQFRAQRVVQAPIIPATVQMNNAPWQMDMEQFPDMGVQAPSQAVGGAWGGNRRW